MNLNLQYAPLLTRLNFSRLLHALTKRQCADISPLTAEWALRAHIDFTLSNAAARRFYSSLGNPLDGKGLGSLSSNDGNGNENVTWK